jgi:N-acetylneuraminate synthase/N,N'-diacetyllegionaminate synthase
VDNSKCLIIAEAGVNHNGNLKTALELCDAAKEAGADVVKFQTWKTEAIITKNVEQAQYQKENTGIQESQFEMLKKLELSQGDFKTIKNHCDEIGIIFASTADEAESLDFLISMGIPFIKIGSGEIGNISYLRYMGSKKLPVILSTGMSSLADIDISVQALRDGGATDITLLHCTTSYPCTMENVNLNAMNTIRDAFKLSVGYSDHTLGNTVAIAAVAMGASVLEKHFTLDKNMEGPDHKASSTPDEFKLLVTEIRNIEKAMGDGRKVPTAVEREISKVVLKRIVAKRPIYKGSIITEDDICVKRNDRGMPASAWDIVVGTKAIKSYKIDEGMEIF